MVRDRPGDHGAVLLGDDERQLLLEPGRDILRAPWLRLEGREAVLDALVVDPRDRGRIVGAPRPRRHARSVRRSASTQSIPIASRAAWVAEAM